MNQSEISMRGEKKTKMFKRTSRKFFQMICNGKHLLKSGPRKPSAKLPFLIIALLTYIILRTYPRWMKNERYDIKTEYRTKLWCDEKKMSSGVWSGRVCNQVLPFRLHWSDFPSRNPCPAAAKHPILGTVCLPQSDAGQWDNGPAYHRPFISSICKTPVLFSSISFLFKSIRTQNMFNTASQSPPILTEQVNPFSALPQISDGHLGKRQKQGVCSRSIQEN